MFQFYLSSIKRGVTSVFIGESLKFQFYLSSIKRIGDKGEETANHGFNSTLVQLKAGWSLISPAFSKKFQFYLSSIKREKNNTEALLIDMFQFYLSSIKRSTFKSNFNVPD